MTEIKFHDAKIGYDNGYWLSMKLDKDTIGAARRFIYGKKDRLYTAEFKEYREKRSLNANAYCWKLIGEISGAVGIPPEQIYREAIRDVGGNFEIIQVQEVAVEHWKQCWQAKGMGWICEDIGRSQFPGHRDVVCFYGSSAYTSDQMSRLIDIIVQECRQLGIETKTPEELAKMIKEWEP